MSAIVPVFYIKKNVIINHNCNYTTLKTFKKTKSSLSESDNKLIIIRKKTIRKEWLRTIADKSLKN